MNIRKAINDYVVKPVVGLSMIAMMSCSGNDGPTDAEYVEATKGVFNEGVSKAIRVSVYNPDIVGSETGTMEKLFLDNDGDGSVDECIDIYKSNGMYDIIETQAHLLKPGHKHRLMSTIKPTEMTPDMSKAVDSTYNVFLGDLQGTFQ